MKRSIVYIDGFNFYYGLLRDPKYKKCKWLDLEKYFRRIRPHDDLQAVKYFTAYWQGDPGLRHRVYTSALGASPLVDVIVGNYKRVERRCKNNACTAPGQRVFYTYEEKHTDVNIALHMLDDAYQGVCDTMILVSADSDLVPALVLIRQRFPKIKLVVYVPGPHVRYRSATEIRSVADDAKSLPAQLLRTCQLPNEVVIGTGTFKKPPTW